MSEHMFVLGIDPGLTTTGYGAVRRTGGRMDAVTVGVVRTDAKAELGTRLRELHADVAGLLAELAPDVMAIERVFVNKNLQTAMAVGRASGVILLAAAQAGVPTVEYTPTAIKSAVTGDGSANKVQVQKMVVSRLRLPATPRPADAADALAIALCHLQSARLMAAVKGGHR